jgi:SAM-dependent MidA family methyltransferase
MEALIKSIILKNDRKAISYDEFINLALYYPDKGYYQLELSPFGKDGDFYTSSFVHHVFAEVMANYFITISKEQKIPLQILELGSGNGRFAKQLLTYFHQHGVNDIVYYFVEQNNRRRMASQEELLNYKNVQGYKSLQDFRLEHGTFEGIIFSNEFLDAMPVKVIETSNNKVYEIKVSLDDQGKFIEKMEPCPNHIIEWLKGYNVSLIDGHRLEIPFYMEDLYQQIHSFFQKGIIVTIDYGYYEEEWKDPRLKSGSLRGYYKHQQYNNVLTHVGLMDITHHVNWNLWEKVGQRYGINKFNLYTQHDFLIQAGILNYLQENRSGSYFSQESKKNRAIQTLISGDFMGRMFQVALQKKI